MKKFLGIFILVLPLVLSGCGQKPAPVVSAPVVKAGIPTETITAHNSENDCWQVINNDVYNLTDYIKIHPGGKSIIDGCGKDATALFESKPGSGQPHSENARTLLEKYYIGSLQK
jgi:cytochrome b involved in lipid metabolism